MAVAKGAFKPTMRAALGRNGCTFHDYPQECRHYCLRIDADGNRASGGIAHSERRFTIHCQCPYSLFSTARRLYQNQPIHLFAGSASFLESNVTGYHSRQLMRLPDTVSHLFTNGSLIDTGYGMGVFKIDQMDGYPLQAGCN